MTYGTSSVRLFRRTATLALCLAMSGGVFAQTAIQPDAAADAGASGDEIVVTAAGFEQKIVDAPASISVISREELQERRFGSLAEALSNVEGIDVGQTAGKTGGLNISIRGMPSDYTLILVDGRRQNAPGNVTPNGFGETSTSFLPPFSAIERIEVVRGPMSTLYGSDAMGGVINLITRKVGKRWAGTVTAEGTLQEDGDFGNMYSTNAYLHGPVIPDLLGLAVRGSYFKREASGLSYTDANGNPVEVSTRGPSPVESEIYTLGGRLTLTPHPDHDIWFEADVNRQWYDNSESQLGTGTVAGGYGPEMKFNRDNYVLAHSWRAGFAQIDTTLTRNITETFGRTIPPGTPGKVAGDPRTLKATNSIADTRAVIPLGPVNATVGGQYWKAEMIDAVAVDKYEFVQWALFAEAAWSIVDRFTLTLGGRYDDHETFGGKFSPRAYAVWNVTDAVTVKGGVSRGFKTPRLDQIAPGIVGFGGQGTIPQIGTPGLKPETSTSMELGLYYDDGGIVSGNVTIFNNKFKDKIAAGTPIPNCTWSVAPNLPGCLNLGNFPRAENFGQTVNVDNAVTRGGEAAVKFQFTEALSLGLNYTYTESEQKSGAEAGEPLVNTPKHMLNGNLRWKLNDRLATWVRAEIRSKRYRGAGAAQNALGSFKGYELFHLGANYQLTDNFRLGAAVYNIFDTDFVGYLPYASSPTATAYASEYANLQEPRRLWISATVDF
ncbi:TonB-dependent receptor domain-containing protein [Sphingobium phenoxybenzoativorans]|uniref:TonB-dependent receptor domain-containing protein n=1 Tax=Sphingobium phenoxybenzoativorans TaxID=1592790 RepID=UPI0008721769|nr:TonB-dependent receptor [Sphingobium phenoxybenzoativorans]